MTESEIVEFALRYDPQPMHVDREAALEGPFGGVIASGWQTAALWMRVFALEFLNRAASLASPGVEELRWLRPVRPGDRLLATYEILETLPSASDPARGTLRGRGELVGESGAPVLRLVARNLFRRRPGPG